MPFHVLSTLALIFGLKSGLTPPCLWSPLLHSRSSVPFSEGVLRCCGIKDIAGEALMASIELQITITQEVSDPQHCRSSETRRLQLWDQGSREKWNRSPGKNRERNYTGSLGQKSCFLHMPFFFSWTSYIWYLSISLLIFKLKFIHTSSPPHPILYGYVNSKEAGAIFYF